MEKEMFATCSSKSSQMHCWSYLWSGVIDKKSWFTSRGTSRWVTFARLNHDLANNGWIRKLNFTSLTQINMVLDNSLEIPGQTLVSSSPIWFRTKISKRESTKPSRIICKDYLSRKWFPRPWLEGRIIPLLYVLWKFFMSMVGLKDRKEEGKTGQLLESSHEIGQQL